MSCLGQIGDASSGADRIGKRVFMVTAHALARTYMSALKSRTGWATACLALSLFMPSQVSASPQSIVVRLVDPRSAKPLSKVSVAMISWSGDLSGRAMIGVEPHQRAQTITDAEGRAVFHIPQPPPEHLGFVLEPPMDFSGCWQRSAFTTETVLHSGIVAGMTNPNVES